MEQNNIYKLVFKVTHAGGSGSCFYLKDYDLFVTNYHVVKGFHDNDRNPYLAKVVLVNPSLDIALLSVDGDFSALPSLNLAGDNSLSIGGKVCVAGYPYGMPFTVTEGSVSSPKQLVDGKYYIQTDAHFFERVRHTYLWNILPKSCIIELWFIARRSIVLAPTRCCWPVSVSQSAPRRPQTCAPAAAS